MKIKTENMSYDEVLDLEPYKNKKPVSQGRFWRWLLKTASEPELKKVSFSCEEEDMDRLRKKEPALYLMNHSSFIDLKIASSIIYPRPFHIVCTMDGFVGKEGLLRMIGCIPTRKFMNDTTLVRDMLYTVRELKESVLLYPEASYTFDGTATPLPDSLGKAVKMLGVPVIMIRTYGAFARDPLYNGLQVRDVKVSAKMSYLLSAEEISSMSAAEINEILRRHFSFDNFRWQQENHISVSEDFRADGLERVLYKCPHCLEEGCMKGKGISLKCTNCGAEYELTEFGKLRQIKTPAQSSDQASGRTAADSITFEHIPDWYAWEREEVRKEIESGIYCMKEKSDIIMLVNTDAVYRVGEGILRHDINGFHLTGCEGKLNYHQIPERSYSLYSDYFWYEIGDMISIGTPKIQYYCFPKNENAIVAKARLAAEELFKLSRHGNK